MVTLVLETGAGVPGANSYVSLAYANEYFDTHPFYSDSWADIADDDRKKQLLIAGSRQLDVLFRWRGSRVNAEQSLDWPRYGVYDDYDAYLSQNSVPERVRQAACEMAYWLTKGDVAAAGQSSSGIEELKIDVIELKFSGSTTLPTVPNPVKSLLRGLGDYVSGFRVRKVLVG